MKVVDYDAEQYQDYAKGRALSAEQYRAWMDAFRPFLPERRPLNGLDVGSGTGRFTPVLARTFGPVTGVEPAARMREVAEAQSRHPDVRYLAGSAEELPVASGSADYAVVMQAWHHVEDRPRAVRELARVLKPGGRLLMFGGFSDQMPRVWWLEQFPRGPEVDASIFPPLYRVVEEFSAAGWRVVSFGTVLEPSSGTRAELLPRLRLRTHSVFALFTEQEVEAGFRQLEEAVAADPDAPVPPVASPLLVLERAQGS